MEIDNLNWEKGGGLLPAVVQDPSTLQVLMSAYMSRESLRITVSSRRVTFFSRTKDRLWTKGETSGNFLELVSITADCDRDSLLIFARPAGPTCHSGTVSCFGADVAPGIGFLGNLEETIDDRFSTRPSGSYTTSLFERGLDRIAQKVGEEAVEVVIAAKNEDPVLLKGEAADLVFHLMVLLKQSGIPLVELVETLRERHQAREVTRARCQTDQSAH